MYTSIWLILYQNKKRRSRRPGYLYQLALIFFRRTRIMGEDVYVLKGQEVVMGKIEGISIRNYGSLKDITLGKTFSHQKRNH